MEKAIQVEKSAQITRRQTELITKTPETENIDSIQKCAKISRKFKHIRNEEDKMVYTSKQEDRKPNWINNCTYCLTAHN